MVNFKIYNVTTWLTNNYTIHILPNTSRRKGNQTMKFSQLIEYETYFSSKIMQKI